MEHEKSVRDAALAFKTAIADAVAAGYRVNWPGNVDGLDKIEISETSKVVDEGPKPATSFRPSRPVGSET